MANVWRGDIAFGGLVKRAQVAGLAAGGFPLGEMQRVLWFARMNWLPLDLVSGDGGGSDEEGGGQEDKEVHHLCEVGWGIQQSVPLAFYR